MSLKKMIIGEEMPSKDDPKYKERYLREKEAGMKFAEKSGINFLSDQDSGFCQPSSNCLHRPGFFHCDRLPWHQCGEYDKII